MLDVTPRPSSAIPEFYAHKVALRGRKPTNQIYQLLKARMSIEGLSVSELAQKLDLRYGVVSRWLEDDETRRTAPSPEACVLIAEKLDIDTIRVFRTCGYLPDEPMSGPRPDWDEDLRELMRRGKRIGRQASSPEVWEMLRVVIFADVRKWSIVLQEFETIADRPSWQDASGETGADSLAEP